MNMSDKDIEKQKRLNDVYRHVYGTDGIDSQTAFANKVGVQRTVMSAAMNGNKSYLTKNLFMKICAAFPGVFNLDYLLTGEGTLLAGDGVSDESINRSYTDTEVDVLKKQIEALEDTIKRQKQIIEHYESFVDLLTRQNHIDNGSDKYVSDGTIQANIYDRKK